MFGIFGKRRPEADATYVIDVCHFSPQDVGVSLGVSGAAKLASFDELSARALYLSSAISMLAMSSGEVGETLAYQVLHIVASGCELLAEKDEVDFGAGCVDSLGWRVSSVPFDPDRQEGTRFRVPVVKPAAARQFKESRSKYLPLIEPDVPKDSDPRDLVVSVPMFIQAWLMRHSSSEDRLTLRIYFDAVLRYYAEDPTRVRNPSAVAAAPEKGVLQCIRSGRVPHGYITWQ